MGPYVIDPKLCEQVSAQMTFITHELAHGEDLAESAAAAVGFDPVAEALTEFSYSWKTHRKVLLDTIDGLAQASSAMGESMTALDLSAATELRQSL